MSTQATTPNNDLALIRSELDRFTVIAATAVFTLIAVAVKTGEVPLPGGTLTLALFPIALFVVDSVRPRFALHHELRPAAAWSMLVLVALTLTPALTQSTSIAIGLPAALASGLLLARSPAIGLTLIAFLTASLGSFEAFVGFSPAPILDLMLAALWVAVVGRVVLGRPDRYVIWPAVLGFMLFVGVSVIDLLSSENFEVAYFGFKATVWYMMALLAVAYAGWSRDTYRRIALGLVGACLVICAYAIFRWITGHAGAELKLAQVAGDGINVDPVDKSVRVIGSFQTAHAMAFWAACMGPFCLAVAMWVTGKWRAVAISAAFLCVVLVIASEIRGPLPGLVGGSILVLVFHQASRAFPGFGRGTAIALVLGVIAVCGGLIGLSAADPERADRFETILDPANDLAFEDRQLKWEQVLDSVEENPLGRGLGTAGSGQAAAGDTIELADFNVDSSYLKIAYEQGLFVMVLFAVTAGGLLLSLVFGSLRTSSKEAAALGLGAAGVLLSVLVSFYTGMYIETTPIIGAWIIVGLGLSHFVARSKTALPPRA